MTEAVEQKYRRKKDEATIAIVKRHARGNIIAQNGYYISQDKLDSMSREADDHIRNLQEFFGKK